jgi:ribosome-associated protein
LNRKTIKKFADVETLSKVAVHAIQEKKGHHITVLDLSKLDNAFTERMILCCGNSDRQTQAIADELEKHIRETLNEKPFSVEGRQTGEWILLDYVNLVVHVFLPRVREYYALDDLWGDAQVKQIPDLA